MGSFFAAIGGWFAKNPLAIVLICVGILFGMVVLSKDATIGELRKAGADKDKRIEAIVSSNTTLRNNNATLSGALEKQNKALENLLTKANEQDARFDQMMAGIAASQKAITGKITAIDNATPGADKCASAFELMRGAAR